MGVFLVKATAPASGEVVPAGNHPAVLVALIDLGTQEENDFNGKKRMVRQIFLVWELTGEKVPGINRNHVIGNKYNLSFGKKSNLRKLAETWRNREYADGEDVDLSNMLGKPCLLGISHKTSRNDRVYAKIDSVAPIPKGLVVPKPGCQTFLWEMGGEDEFPDWLPFIFGRPVDQVINDSAERRGVATNGHKESDTIGLNQAVVDEEAFDRF